MFSKVNLKENNDGEEKSKKLEKRNKNTQENNQQAGNKIEKSKKSFEKSSVNFTNQKVNLLIGLLIEQQQNQSLGRASALQSALFALIDRKNMAHQNIGAHLFWLRDIIGLGEKIDMSASVQVSRTPGTTHERTYSP